MKEEKAPPIYPQAEFAVLSDVHIYDTSLGTEGKAFNKYLNNDRKMLIQSLEILAIESTTAICPCGFYSLVFFVNHLCL